MAGWSAKNATNAYLKTLRMGPRAAKQPEAAEFISALAAGQNSQLMVIAATGTTTASTILALVAAAHQTGGRVVCIHRTQEETELVKQAMRYNNLGQSVLGFVTGSAQVLLSAQAQYGGADFVLIDCGLENHEEILGAARAQNGVVAVGYNIAGSGKVGSGWCAAGWKTQMLPIGEGGLLVTRMAPPTRKVAGGGSRCGSRWVVKVDKCTGEEHMFWVR